MPVMGAARRQRRSTERPQRTAARGRNNAGPGVHNRQMDGTAERASPPAARRTTGLFPRDDRGH